MSTILDFVPEGYTLRPNQRDTLLEVEAAWDTTDVFSILGPTGSGKSLILHTIAQWAASFNQKAAIVTPRVTLQEQYLDSFPKLPNLKGTSRYKCKDKMFSNCNERKKCTDYYCKGCPYKADKEKAKKGDVALFNPLSYRLLGDFREVLLCDEAHMLFPILSDALSLNMWQHKYKYDSNSTHYADILVWIERYRVELQKQYDRTQKDRPEPRVPPTKQDLAINRSLLELEREIDRLERIYRGISIAPTNYYLEHAQEVYRGVTRPLLRVRPTTLEGAPPFLWPSQTKKIILASGTIDDEDIKKLGLGHRRITRIVSPSPIPPGHQPIILKSAGNMGYKYQDKNIPRLVKTILELQKKHSDTKGMVHMTYSMSEKIAPYLIGKGPFLFHDSETKEDVLKLFYAAEPGTVMIACACEEGIDLAGKDYGWQALAKMPFPSLADKLNAYWYENDKDWINYLVAQKVEQASGRICRGPTDRGITYILDGAAGNPRKNRYGVLTTNKFFSQNFLERLVL